MTRRPCGPLLPCLIWGYAHVGYGIGGVLIDNNGKMALSGCPTIVGNSNKDSGQNSNVRLSSDLTTSDSMISIVGELTNTTPIGIAKDITEKNQGVFTTGSTDAFKYGGNEVMAFSALSYARAALSGSPGQDAANAMCALYRYFSTNPNSNIVQ